MTEIVEEARGSRRTKRSSAAAEFEASNEVVDDDAVVNGGGRIDRGARLDDGNDLWAALKLLGRGRKVRPAAEPSGGDKTSSL